MFIKKRSLALFLIFVLTVTLLGGCSSKENNEMCIRDRIYILDMLIIERQI